MNDKDQAGGLDAAILNEIAGAGYTNCDIDSIPQQGICPFVSPDSKDCTFSGRSWGLDDTLF